MTADEWTAAFYSALATQVRGDGTTFAGYVVDAMQMIDCTVVVWYHATGSIAVSGRPGGQRDVDLTEDPVAVATEIARRLMSS